MNVHYIADLHLGGNLYCPPFKSKEHYVKRVIDNINQKCKPDDILMHIGDFTSYGNVGYTGSDGKRIVTESLRLNGQEYLEQINCQVILTEGNHCEANRTKAHLVTSFVSLGSKLTAFLSHYPSDSDKNVLFYPVQKWYKLVECASIISHACICGHVHNAPKIRYDKRLGYVNINVSAQARNFMPVSTAELVKEYEDFIKIPRK